MIKATCTFIDLYPARIDEVSSFSRRPVNFCLRSSEVPMEAHAGGPNRAFRIPKRSTHHCPASAKTYTNERVKQLTSTKTTSMRPLNSEQESGLECEQSYRYDSG